MLQKKPGVLNLITLAYFSSKKMIDVIFRGEGPSRNSKCLSVSQSDTKKFKITSIKIQVYQVYQVNQVYQVYQVYQFFQVYQLYQVYQ